MKNKLSNSELPAKFTSTLVAGLMLGSAMGVLVGAYDVIFRAPLLEADFVIVALVFYMAIGGGMGVGLAIGSMGIQRIAGWSVTSVQMVAWVTGLGLCFAAILVCRRVVAFFALPVSLMVAIQIARGWPRINRRALLAWWLLFISVATIVSIARVCDVLPQSNTLTGVIAIVLAGVFMTVGRRVCERATRPVMVVCVVGLCATCTWSAIVFNQPLRNLPDAPHHRGSGHPNVVLLVIDTLRRDHVGAYGHEGGLTPTLDRFALESTLYEDAFSTAPWTVPSHASMFTGYYPKSHGTSSEDHLWLDDDLLTLPEMLHDQGFQTVSITANVTIETANFDQGFDHHLYLRRPKSNGSLRLTPWLQQLGFPSRWMDKGSATSVVELGKWFQSGYENDKPFFLFVNVMEPHQPYQPPLNYRDKHLPAGRGHLEAARLGARDFDGTKWHARQEDDSARSELARALYAAEVAYQDEQVGQLLEMIRGQVDLDETMIIVTADHGENLGEAKRWGHLFAVNDYLLHVPLMIRYPEKFPAAKRIRGLCQLTDLVPTIFDVLNMACPIENLPGGSIVPEFFQPAAAVYAQWWPNQWGLRMVMGALGRQAPLDAWTAYQRVIRTQDYKYIWSSDGRHRLYDIKHDPDEEFNLIMQESDIAKKLDLRLWAWWRDQPDYRYQATKSDTPLDPKSIEMLKSIGYIGD